MLDLIKEEQISDEVFVADDSNEENRDAGLYFTERELECLTQGEEVTNIRKDTFKQGSSI